MMDFPGREFKHGNNDGIPIEGAARDFPQR